MFCQFKKLGRCDEDGGSDVCLIMPLAILALPLLFDRYCIKLGCIFTFDLMIISDKFRVSQIFNMDEKGFVVNTLYGLLH